MRKTSLALYSVGLIAVLPSSPTSGAALQLFGQDAYGLGRADAFVATANNPSAVFYNPAGITQLSGEQLRLGTYAITYQVDYRAPSNAEFHSAREFQALPQLYYTTSLTNYPVSFGFGLFSPFGLIMKWPENSGFRSVAQTGKIAYLTAEPVAAWQIHRTLSIAAGPSLNYSQTILSQGLSPFPGNDSFRFRGDGWAAGYSLGLRWQPLETHAFGLTYRSATTMNYHGHTQTSAVLPPLSLRLGAELDFEFPQSITAGWSWRPAPAWNLEVNTTWMDWSSFSLIENQQSVPVPPIVLNWRSTWNFALGVTRELGHHYHVSGGYLYCQDSVPNDHFTPLVPDTDRHSFSLGFGRETETWSWDIAYQITRGLPRTIQGSTPSLAGQSADGRYNWWNHALSVSVGWKF